MLVVVSYSPLVTGWQRGANISVFGLNEWKIGHGDSDFSNAASRYTIQRSVSMDDMLIPGDIVSWNAKISLRERVGLVDLADW